MICRRPPILTPAVAAATLALLLAACGGSHRPSTTSASSGSAPPSAAGQHQAEEAALRFGNCMRSHGVPTIADPSNPRAFKDSVSNAAAHSPAFAAADARCRHFLPGGGIPNGPNETPAQVHAHTVALLAFAGCLRTHGFPKFPDPTTGGQVTREMLAAVGIDLHQPAVIRVADGCVGVTHGVITRALVARFVAGQ